MLGTIATDHTRSLLGAHGERSGPALTSGYHLAFLVAAGWVAVGIVAAVVLVRPRRAPAFAAGGARLEPRPESHQA